MRPRDRSHRTVQPDMGGIGLGLDGWAEWDTIGRGRDTRRLPSGEGTLGGAPMLRGLSLLVMVTTLITAACAQDDTTADTTAVTSTTTLSTTVATTTIPPVPATTVSPPPATTVPPVATTTVPSSTGSVGESYEFWVPLPSEGAILGVVGVRYDDMLNVRSGPDVTFDVIATLEPAQTEIAGTGEGWQLPSGSVWWKIEADGVVGWANQRFLSRLGGVDDLTAFVVGELGEVPVAETMVGLGLIVANTFAGVDSGSDVVISVAPTVGDLGEVTYDVIGLGDDSLGGYRLHTFGQPTDGGFSLMAVEATTMCQRGVSGGLCI